MSNPAFSVEAAVDAFAALAHPTRLATVKLLVRAWPDGLSAGAVAAAVDAPASTMSTNFAVLVRAGLITAHKTGRSIAYAADLPGISRVIGFLVEDCCERRPEVCAPLVQATASAAACCPANEDKVPKRRGRSSRRTVKA